jgi:class 3 adenylate cyclase
MTGLAISLLCTAAFGFSFIISGYWIDPFIPAAAILGGTLFLCVSGFCISYGRMLRFRLAYTGLVNNNMLKRLVRMGRPPLTETLTAQAVIIAVKNAGMSGKEDRETPSEAARAAVEFRREFSRIFKRHGALILGIENDIALACFGSPPQRLCGEAVTHPAALAIPCIREILNRESSRNPLTAAWHLGIEAGECSFSWSEETGYTAHGRPMIRARLFTSLAVRYNVRAIIGETARKSSGLNLHKLASLAGDDFYELPV